MYQIDDFLDFKGWIRFHRRIPYCWLLVRCFSRRWTGYNFGKLRENGFVAFDRSDTWVCDVYEGTIRNFQWKNLGRCKNTIGYNAAPNFLEWAPQTSETLFWNPCPYFWLSIFLYFILFYFFKHLFSHIYYCKFLIVTYWWEIFVLFFAISNHSTPLPIISVLYLGSTIIFYYFKRRKSRDGETLKK